MIERTTAVAAGLCLFWCGAVALATGIKQGSALLVGLAAGLFGAMYVVVR